MPVRRSSCCLRSHDFCGAQWDWREPSAHNIHKTKQDDEVETRPALPSEAKNEGGPVRRSETKAEVRFVDVGGSSLFNVGGPLPIPVPMPALTLAPIAIGECQGQSGCSRVSVFSTPRFHALYGPTFCVGPSGISRGLPRNASIRRTPG
jgi:hypothetical protein